MTHVEKLFGLQSKVAIVTGGARGIGKCAAENMAAVGADIVIFDVLEELAAQTAAEIADAYSVRTAGFYCDVTKPEQVKETIAAAADKMGALDLLLNNAGICIQTPAEDVPPDEWLKVLDVNLNGIFYMAQAFGKWLIAHNRGGAIVNTASMSASIINTPQPQASYNATKAAVKHLTKSLAVEWVSKGIRVNSISPGYILTDLTAAIRKDYRDSWIAQIPMHRMGTPQELAGAIIYLFSDSAAYTSGCDVIIDGCFTAI
ncbi:MAG: SDR family oxidoreductase [Treponema sp.]|jgi:NAD(P)-dependent dehydrogenase (short-subunit alcohol dehydrogenase family)|nr:SDR family oxidoreductase [Treponema sp.]